MKIKVVSIIVCIALILVSLASCNSSASKIKAEEDLKNKKIGVIASTKSDVFASKYTQNGCEILKYSSYIGLEKALEAGEIDCAVMDENTAKARAKQGAEIKIVEQAIGQDTLTFVTAESKRVYNVMLNKALESLTADGTIDEIINAYLEDNNYVYEYAENTDESNGSFTIVIDPAQVPYVFPSDETREKPGGINLALIDAICSSLGCGYTLLPLSGESLASSLRMGIADFAIGSFDLENTDQEGVELLMESTPVLTYNHVIVTKK